MLALAAAFSFALPLHFEQNQGQRDPQIRFMGVAPDYTLELLDTGIHLRTSRGAIDLNLPAAKLRGLEPQIAKSNYYSGTRPSDWHTDIANFGRVRYSHVFRDV